MRQIFVLEVPKPGNSYFSISTLDKLTVLQFHYLKFSVSGPNFFETPSIRCRAEGWMKVLPMYRFLIKTSMYGIPTMWGQKF